MDHFKIYNLANQYFLDKLQLRDTEISHILFTNTRGYQGCAKGNWDSKGILIGGLGIEIKNMGNLVRKINVLAHELLHIKQYVDGVVSFKGNNRLYAGYPDHYNYNNRMTEIEVRRGANVITRNFINKYYSEFSLLVKSSIFVYQILDNNLSENHYYK